ncbi:MAG: hypothetical protein Q7R71_01330 [bacterium]|nr:hypothetical protein [bacterium]
MAKSYLEMFEIAREQRRQPPVPHEFVDLALVWIKRGFIEAYRYENGEPVLEDLYNIATLLEASSHTLH